jgi:hypothetical protein
MSMRVAFLAALLALAGCSSFGDYSVNGSMTRDSDDCRAQALLDRSAAADPDAEDKQAAFDRVYRGCMRARGYPLT